MKTVYTIGRDPSCDIVIDDYTNNVSRFHATLRIQGKKYFLTDHSTNGTYRNGVRLAQNTEFEVSKEDEISFSNVCYFNWSDVPDSKGVKGPLKVVVITLCSIVAIAGIAAICYFCIPSFRPAKKTAPVDQPVQVDSTQIKKEAEAAAAEAAAKAKATEEAAKKAKAAKAKAAEDAAKKAKEAEEAAKKAPEAEQTTVDAIF